MNKDEMETRVFELTNPMVVSGHLCVTPTLHNQVQVPLRHCIDMLENPDSSIYRVLDNIGVDELCYDEETNRLVLGFETDGNVILARIAL